MRKVLITGGAGFIGCHLARRLLADGYEVAVMDNLFTGNKSSIYDLVDNPRFTFILHDVTQPFWGQFDEVYNLACPASPIHYQSVSGAATTRASAVRRPCVPTTTGSTGSTCASYASSTPTGPTCTRRTAGW